uniref:Uncharacterized protein n=1 Tax=Picea sitchensis TaxID=3332 RepID=A9NZD7_PICSI|nr:unknown [Picea sitchensis]
MCEISTTSMTLPLRVRLQAGQIINDNLFFFCGRAVQGCLACGASRFCVFLWMDVRVR